MKKIVVISLLLVFQTIQAQENNPNFTYKSFSITPIEIYLNSGREGGGVSMSTDVSFLYKKNIFSISGGIASEFEVFEDRLESYKSLNLLYGREWTLGSSIHVELHGGAGYFFFKKRGSSFLGIGDETNTTIGFPLVFKLKFRTGKRFCLGFRIERNFNSINNIASIGLLLQWNRLIKK